MIILFSFAFPPRNNTSITVIAVVVPVVAVLIIFFIVVILYLRSALNRCKLTLKVESLWTLNVLLINYVSQIIIQLFFFKCGKFLPYSLYQTKRAFRFGLIFIYYLISIRNVNEYSTFARSSRSSTNIFSVVYSLC